MKRFPISIIDDFLPDPDYVADLARNVKYGPTLSSAPGEKSDSLFNIDPNLHEWLANKIIGTWWDMRQEDIQWMVAFDFMRVPPDGLDGLIHTDTGEASNNYKGTELAGILYLNKSLEENTGTSIYRQKNSYGLDYDPYKEIGEVIKNKEKNPELYKEVLSRYNDNFEEVVRVQNRYNRFMCYPGDQWHAATNYGTPGTEIRYTLRVFFACIWGLTTTYPLDRMAYKYERFNPNASGNIDTNPPRTTATTHT